MGALLTDRVGAVLGALKRMRPWKQAVRTTLAQLIGYVERHRTRIRYQEPWHCGRAVGSGAVEGACKHVIQSRFKRAGMRWKPPGFLNGLALRLARLNGTFQAFWASRGLVVQTSVCATKWGHTRGDVRGAAGKRRQPSAGRIDSPSIKPTATGGSAAMRRTSPARGARGIAWSLPSACSWPLSSRPPMCQTVTGRTVSWRSCGPSCRGGGLSGLMGPLPARS
jgi:hypothetical protein